jgi:MOSC domain-containing protein YiiM
MIITSTNIGEPRLIEWRGQQLSTGIYKYPTDQPIFLGNEDVEGDHVIDRRYHGGTDKACYLYSADHYSFWKEKYPDADWELGMFGENLTVEGLNEAEIRIGDRYLAGDAIVEVSQPRQPCFKLGIRFGNQQVVDDFWLSAFPGVYVRIIQNGRVKPGDRLQLISRNEESLSVAEVFSVFRKDVENVGLMKKAVNDPRLADSCAKDIRKILDQKL